MVLKATFARFPQRGVAAEVPSSPPFVDRHGQRTRPMEKLVSSPIFERFLTIARDSVHGRQTDGKRHPSLANEP
jgi:hypothetical protein